MAVRSAKIRTNVRSLICGARRGLLGVVHRLSRQTAARMAARWFLTPDLRRGGPAGADRPRAGRTRTSRADLRSAGARSATIEVIVDAATPGLSARASSRELRDPHLAELAE